MSKIAIRRKNLSSKQTVENNQLKSVNNENVLLKEQASNKEKEVQEFKEKLVQQQAKFEELEKEQEDILVLMGNALG